MNAIGRPGAPVYEDDGMGGESLEVRWWWCISPYPFVSPTNQPLPQMMQNHATPVVAHLDININNNITARTSEESVQLSNTSSGNFLLLLETTLLVSRLEGTLDAWRTSYDTQTGGPHPSV